MGSVAEVTAMLIVASVWFYITSMALTSWVASVKGRSALGWLVISFFVSPPLCLIALAAIPEKRQGQPHG